MENEVVWLVALMSYMMQYCSYTHAYGGMHFGRCNCSYTCAKEGVIPRRGGVKVSKIISGGGLIKV